MITNRNRMLAVLAGVLAAMVAEALLRTLARDAHAPDELST